MAAALAAGNLVQLRVWSEIAAAFQAAVNTAWYVVSSVGASAATDQDMADHMDSVIAPVYKPLLANVAEYKGVQVSINRSTFPYRQINLPVAQNTGAGVGTGGAIPMPKQTAGLLRFQTLNAGPAGRGRWYLPFPPQDADSGGGTASAAYVLALLALGGEVGVGISLSASGRTAILVRALVHNPPKGGGPVPVPSPVVDFVGSPFWATQKRRGSFGRTNKSPI